MGPCETLFLTTRSSGSVLLFGKDIYVLELAADVNLMGAFGTALAIWGLLCVLVTEER